MTIQPVSRNERTTLRAVPFTRVWLDISDESVVAQCEVCLWTTVDLITGSIERAALSHHKHAHPTLQGFGVVMTKHTAGCVAEPECIRPPIRKGLCHTHYMRLWRAARASS
ncbi:hypothetical protein LG314_07970 [Agrococcus terreus]|uniref:hypothetical protein n=1 Tax=Agrococcus terreus TaxID=574649 RepID=UPI00384CE776